MKQSELFSQNHATKAGLTLEILGLTAWDEEQIKALQRKLKVKDDGFFGTKSVKAFKATLPKPEPVKDSKEGVIVGGVFHLAPAGLSVIPMTHPKGIPTHITNTSERTRPVTQFVLHRGAELLRKSDNGNYAKATERVLDARDLSSTFSMDVDGVIYQHFDPATRRGRHCVNFNVHSDSMDVGGPFSRKNKPVAGQTPVDLPVAIGRKGDGKKPKDRKYWPMKCWSLTPAQVTALRAFIPWYCTLRGIPLRACSDLRTWTAGGLGLKDPVVNETGIIAHMQVAAPGDRVDGAIELQALLGISGIDWREDFIPE